MNRMLREPLSQVLDAHWPSLDMSHPLNGEPVEAVADVAIKVVLALIAEEIKEMREPWADATSSTGLGFRAACTEMLGLVERLHG